MEMTTTGPFGKTSALRAQEMPEGRSARTAARANRDRRIRASEVEWPDLRFPFPGCGSPGLERLQDLPHVLGRGVGGRELQVLLHVGLRLCALLQLHPAEPAQVVGVGEIRLDSDRFRQSR